MNLYEKLGAELEQQIKNGTFKYGERLPSIRSIHKESTLSISTVLQAMYWLESRGLVEAKPKKGYFVTYQPHQLVFQAVKYPARPSQGKEGMTDFVHKVYGMEQEELELTDFSLGAPHSSMLPIAKLKKIIRETLRESPEACTQYEPIQGSRLLRRQIAKRTTLWEKGLSTEELVTTNGCIHALAISLMALTKKGDTILTESPVYFGTLQLAQSLGLQCIEMPTHSLHGIDLEVVKGYLKNSPVAAIIVVSNFNNPLGFSMSEQSKRALVKICTNHQVPLIEEDLYGDVYFGKERPISCKSIDKEGIVLWCSSVSKTLAPGYRVGWIAPGKFMDDICRVKLVHSISCPTLLHESIAKFIDKSRYENHLRQLRSSLQHNLHKYLHIIQEYFPENTKVTFPDGGFLLWLELDPRINTGLLYEPALRLGIKYAPGRMFTLKDQYNNCLRLSFGLPWDEQTATALTKLGLLLQHQLVNY
ncbi:GntR family transcriptional regulator [Echinicola pacifica]|uniref:GntR family transcriptional regulator n=1 Tax=Echinicola pacifica TaxID=346377 RepID=A0A918Q8H9_9BACT|nr:PLP-dependent aminotransferase family protein [Echinicola pacifica]GGZ34639.1 GntR family transcriptional regulator [Echinicola pacifica]